MLEAVSLLEAHWREDFSGIELLRFLDPSDILVFRIDQLGLFVYLSLRLGHLLFQLGQHGLSLLVLLLFKLEIVGNLSVQIIIDFQVVL